MAFTKVTGPGIHTLANITSHNINSSGIITATKFVGPLEASSGSSGTFDSLTITGNVSIGGTLTYEDVKNVDSVGIVTARAGVKVTGGDLAMDTAGNITLGDSSSSSDNRIHIGAGNDIKLYHYSGVNYIDLLSNTEFRGSSSTIKIKPKTSEEGIIIAPDGSVSLYHNNAKTVETAVNALHLTGNAAESNIKLMTSDGTQRAFIGATNGNEVTFYNGTSEKIWNYTNNGPINLYHDNALKLATTSTGVEVTGGIKLNQSQSKINLNTSDGSDNKFLSINGGGDASQSRGAGITWYGNEVGSHEGRLQILAGNSGSANGVVQMHTGGAERLRIASDGKVRIGADTYGASGLLHIVGDDNSNGPELYLQVNNNNTTDNIGAIWFGNNVDKSIVKLAGHTHSANNTGDFTVSTSSGGTLGEKLRIRSDGQVCLGTTSGPGQVGLYLGDGSNPAGHIYANGTHHLYLLANAYHQSGWKYLGNGEAQSISLQDGEFVFSSASANSSGAGQAVSWSTKFLINSSGAFGLGGSTYGSSGQVLTSAGSGGVPTWTTISAGIDSDSDSNTVGGTNAGNAGTWSGATSNTCFGKDAGTDITDSDGGTFFGHQAGANVTSGNNNVAVGYVSILENTTGTENTAIGNYSMQRSTGSNNTAVGSFALRGVSGSSGGGGNTAVGAYALDAYTSSSNNTAVGWRAMSAKTSGDGNTAIGKDALRLNQTGGENTIVGEAAADSNTSNRNTVIGKNALYSNTGGYDNVVIGRYAMMLSNSGNSLSTQGCTVIGTNAMYTGGGDGNIAIGAAAAYNFTSAHNNTVVGGAAFDANTTGNYTVAIGNNCLGAFNNSAAELVAIGSQCAVSLTSGNESVYIGRECASNITGGAYNVIIGKGAMAGSTGSNVHSNVVLGRSAGRLITSSNNIVLGREAAYDMTSGNENIIMGHEAAYNLTTGGHNIIMGYQAAKNKVLTSSSNVMIGSDVCKDIHASSGSIVAIGRYALDAYDGYGGGSFGGWTVAIGTGAMGVNRNTRHSVCIGNNAGGNWNPTEGNLHEGGCVFIGGSAGGDGPTTATAAVVVGRNAYSSGNNKTGANNVAIGVRSLEQATSGQHNVCMGTFAGYRITTGNNNVMIGYLAGYAYDTTNGTQTGSQNTMIGGYTKASAQGTTYENCWGYGVTGKGTNTSMVKGSSGVYQQNNSSSWSTTSDIRIKKNVVDNNVGLDAIEKIRVRNFEYRTKEEITDFENPEAVVCDKTGTQLGVIAQEIHEVLPDVVEQQTTGAYTVNPDNLTWYLVNAVKELSAEVKALKAQLNS